MKKSDDRRADIIKALSIYVLAEGLAASNLRALAAAAGLSDRMLLYYYKDKDDIIAATLESIAAQLTILLGARTAAKLLPFAQLRAALASTLFVDDLWPYMTLWLEIAGLSARGDRLYRAVGEQLGRGFLAWGASQLDCTTDAQRMREAAQLLIEIEGMVLLKSIGMSDVCLQTG
jgi:AcrR family transcriptional regulator